MSLEVADTAPHTLTLCCLHVPFYRMHGRSTRSTAGFSHGIKAPCPMMFYVVNDKTGRGAGSRGYVIDLFLLLLLVLPSLLSVLVCGIAITTALIYHTPMSNGSIAAMTAITVLLLLLLLISSFLSCAPNACFSGLRVLW